MKLIQFEITNSEHEIISDIARRRGTTVTAVLRGAAAATAREFSRPFNQRVAELHEQNLTSGQIGHELGVTNTKVRAALGALGLTPNKPAPTPVKPRPITPRSRTSA